MSWSGARGCLAKEQPAVPAGIPDPLPGGPATEDVGSRNEHHECASRPVRRGYDTSRSGADRRTAEDGGERSEQLGTAVLDLLDETALSTEMAYHFAEGGRSSPARFAVSDVLRHRVEAMLQHGGEVNALFWHFHIDPPIATVDDWNAPKGGAAECPEAFPGFWNPAVRSERDGPYSLNCSGRGEVLGPRRKPWIRQSDGFSKEGITGPPGPDRIIY